MAVPVGHGGRWTNAAAGLCLLLGCAVASARPDIPPGPSPQFVPATESKGLGGAPAVARKSAGAPGSRDEAKSWISQTTVSLAGVLAVAVGIGVAVRFVSRRQGGLRSSLSAGGRSPAGIMEVLGRYPVGRGATLVLLKLDRRVLLLSQCSLGKLGMGSSFSTLCEITDPDEVASILVKTRDDDGDSMTERFTSMLSRFDRKMDTPSVPPGGRKVRAGSDGDRAEMWDADRSDIPVVDLTQRPADAQVGDAAGSLRRRLAAIRWPSQEGGERP